MKLGAMMMAAATAFGSGKMQAASRATLTVYVRSDVVPNEVILGGEQIARKILAEAGVEVQFKNHGAPGDETPSQIVMHVEVRVDNNDYTVGGALGFAMPYASGSAIRISYNRLRWAERRKMTFAATLFGHVLAHEIGHNLQRVARHSDRGVMKAYWTSADYTEMSKQPLHFDRYDVELIQLGVAERLASTHEAVSTPASSPVN